MDMEYLSIYLFKKINQERTQSLVVFLIQIIYFFFKLIFIPSTALDGGIGWIGCR